MAAVASPVDRGVTVFVWSGWRTSVVQEDLHQVVVAADGREMNRRPTQFVPGERGRERGREGVREREEERKDKARRERIMWSSWQPTSFQ